MKALVSRVSSIVIFLLLIGGINAANAGTRTLRIVCYNIDCDTGTTTPGVGLISPDGTNTLAGGVLEGIGEEIVGSDPAQPIDVLALEETTSDAVTVAPIVTGLNTYYKSTNMYAMSPVQAKLTTGTGNGPNAMVYNTLTLQLVASIPVDPPGGSGQIGSGSGELREVMRYEFAPAGVTPSATNEFYVYVSHYKSSSSGNETTNEMERAEEATIIRNDEANNLPANSRVIYVGDYNIGGSGEASYQIMLANTAPDGIAQGQGIDVMNLSNNTNIDWTASGNLSVKTESSRSLHYRDDLQVMTTNIYFGTPGGLAYVTGTYHAFGNNGTTGYETSVTAAGNTALSGNLTTNALYAPLTASQLYLDLSNNTDHLPVVADYTIGIPNPPVANFITTPTNGTVSLNVTFTDASTTGSPITNYSWNFGDGSATNGAVANVSHTYTTTGTFTVTEIATSAFGSGTNTQTNLISVLTPYQAWQLQYFGCTNCPQSQTNADFDGTGQNNLFKYVAGLNPTNPTSVFTFTVGVVPNHPTWRTLVINPVVSGHSYIPQFTTNLATSPWQTLTTVTSVTNNTQRTITDTNATSSQEFYRINVTFP